MDGFVLDASVAISWCFPNDPTENTPHSRAILRHLEEVDVVVPEVWAFEVANGIFVAYSKRKRIDEADIRDYLQLLESLPIRLVSRGWLKNIALESLARKPISLPTTPPTLTSLSMKSLPLATLDHDLKRAALAEGVSLI